MNTGEGNVVCSDKDVQLARGQGLRWVRVFAMNHERALHAAYFVHPEVAMWASRAGISVARSSADFTAPCDKL